MTCTETKSYYELLQSAEWQNCRQLVLQRDGYKCRNCGSANVLQVHHRQYHVDAVSGWRKAPWDYALHYLVTLCATCHQLGHKQYAVPVFQVY